MCLFFKSISITIETCAGLPVHLCHVLVPGKEERAHGDDATGRLHRRLY